MDAPKPGDANTPQFVGLTFIRNTYGLSRHMLQRLVGMGLVRYVALPGTKKFLYRLSDVDRALATLETTGAGRAESQGDKLKENGHGTD